MRPNSHRRLAAAALLAAGCLVRPGRSDPAADAETLAIPLVDGPVRLDGRLDEPAWKQAAEFPMNEPVGADALPPGWASSVRVGRAAGGLYLGFRIENPTSALSERPRARTRRNPSTRTSLPRDLHRHAPAARQPPAHVSGRAAARRRIRLGRDAALDWDGDWEAATVLSAAPGTRDPQSRSRISATWRRCGSTAAAPATPRRAKFLRLARAGLVQPSSASC